MGENAIATRNELKGKVELRTSLKLIAKRLIRKLVETNIKPQVVTPVVSPPWVPTETEDYVAMDYQFRLFDAHLLS